MHKQALIHAIATVLVAVTASVQAAPAEPTAAAAAASETGSVQYATPKSDVDEYLSDRLSFTFDKQVQLVNTTDERAKSEDACVPADTTLKIIGKAELNGTPMVMARVNTEPAGQTTADPAADKPPTKQRKFQCTNDKRVALGDVVLLDSAQFKNVPPHRFGLTYGMLVVPYKYHFGGNREFSGSSSLGGYLGYREAKTGYSLRLIGFAGATIVPFTQETDGKQTTKNLTGLSYGLGVLGTVKDSFQLGLVLGWDRVGASAGYPNDGKPWLAVSLGYGFSN
jgi:hypothetical protein